MKILNLTVSSQLYVYPVKGLRPIALQTATLGPQGIRHDRSFMLMTTHRNKAGGLQKMQLAAFPECALFSQKIVGEDIVVEYHPAGAAIPGRGTASSVPVHGVNGVNGVNGANGANKLNKPNQPNQTEGAAKPTAPGSTMASSAPPPLHIPLAPAPADLAPMDVDLHGSPARGCRMGPAYDAWFSACFGFNVVLVYIGRGRRRVLAPSMRPPRATRWVVAQKRATQTLRTLRDRPPVRTALVVGVWLSLLAAYGAAGWVAAAVMLALGVGAAAAQLLCCPPGGGDALCPEPWITFTDCAPFLVTSEASRRNVNGRLSAPDADVPMYKFRPNIVVDGEDAWAEDFWAELVVEGTVSTPSSSAPTSAAFRLLLTSNCARCTSLNVDYGTGRPAAGELGEVLKRLSKDRRVDTGIKYSPVFGRYAFLDGEGDREMAVGDSVVVKRRNKERTTWDWPGL